MKTLKKIGKIYGRCLIVYWCVAGIMALASAGWNWGASSFKQTVFNHEMKKRFLP